MLDLLTVALAVLGSFIAAVAARFAWKQLYPPDRRLLLHTSQGPEGEQQTLVTISSVGKYDVSDQQFRDKPLTLTLTSPAQSVLSTKLSSGRTPMLCEARDGKLVINPGLIQVGESLAILIETRDAGTATVTHLDHQMPEVKLETARSGRKIQRQTEGNPRRPKSLGVQLTVSTALAASLLLAGVLGIISILSPPPLSVTPKPVAPGEMATACGSDLHPFDVVELELGSETGIDQSDRDIASGQVDSSGEFCVPFRIPEATSVGNSELTIRLVNGNRTKYHYVEMSVAAK